MYFSKMKSELLLLIYLQVKQLHSQVLVRHGVMLVGPTGGGKTAARNILQRALVLLPTLSVDDVEINHLGNRIHRRSVTVVSTAHVNKHVTNFTS